MWTAWIRPLTTSIPVTSVLGATVSDPNSIAFCRINVPARSESTTPTLEGMSIQKYHGVVTGEAILGANVFKDFFAGIRDIVGGRWAAYVKGLQKSRAIAVGFLFAKAGLTRLR